MTDRIDCDRCGAPYAPSLTRWRCPVCDLAAPGGELALRAWDDPDDRVVAMVVMAMIANVLLLAVLALVVLK